MAQVGSAISFIPEGRGAAATAPWTRPALPARAPSGARRRGARGWEGVWVGGGRAEWASRRTRRTAVRHVKRRGGNTVPWWPPPRMMGGASSGRSAKGCESRVAFGRAVDMCGQIRPLFGKRISFYNVRLMSLLIRRPLSRLNKTVAGVFGGIGSGGSRG